mmetsp:Transcript_44382/g.105113  ORF Transcript_44382/g.105113 Transcript_44382/m.105113 type:complete len:242 (-) Transcript_44382:164-889(-)
MIPLDGAAAGGAAFSGLPAAAGSLLTMVSRTVAFEPTFRTRSGPKSSSYTSLSHSYCAVKNSSKPDLFTTRPIGTALTQRLLPDPLVSSTKTWMQGSSELRAQRGHSHISGSGSDGSGAEGGVVSSFSSSCACWAFSGASVGDASAAPPAAATSAEAAPAPAPAADPAAAASSRACLSSGLNLVAGRGLSRLKGSGSSKGTSGTLAAARIGSSAPSGLPRRCPLPHTWMDMMSLTMSESPR